jgi:hypothetical protein
LIGYSLISLSSSAIVWTGGLPARVELRDENGALTLRADFDVAGLVVPTEQAPTHQMVERYEIDRPSETAVRGEATESYDGQKVIVDPHWYEPEPEEGE